MSARAVEKTRVGVLVDPPFAREMQDASWRPEDALIEVADNLEGALARLLEARPDVVVTAGDDAFVGRIVSRYEFSEGLKKRPLRLYPSHVDGASQLARAMGAKSFTPRLIRRLVKRVRNGDVHREQVGTLKAVVSSDPHARLGFSFGAGIFYRIFEAYKRAQTETSGRVAGTLLGLAKDTLLEGGRNLEPVQARLSVDGEPVGETIGYLVCSSLSRTWLGLGMDANGAAASYRVGDRGRELIKKVASSRALPGFVRSDTANPFERIDIDWSSGFVMDGELVEPGGAHALRVEPGPAIECVTL
ncbi:MAG: hypothetical protein ACQEVA_03510 [Myxococcota bacterium]